MVLLYHRWAECLERGVLRTTPPSSPCLLTEGSSHGGSSWTLGRDLKPEKRQAPDSPVSRSLCLSTKKGQLLSPPAEPGWRCRWWFCLPPAVCSMTPCRSVWWVSCRSKRSPSEPAWWTRAGSFSKPMLTTELGAAGSLTSAAPQRWGAAIREWSQWGCCGLCSLKHPISGWRRGTS